ncbi:FecR domain-containing protein [uncultured Chitinophaga sp.]|uniref:FecR family protein n=1 Tax=uncultured Chitinophaga sp. TaxID=339340 RepID=UPI0025D382EB|nr:FecR domain-containing protein [uncultured Chitinophaga sp.]
MNRLEHLYQAYMEGKLSLGEKRELWELLTDPANEAEVKALMDARFDMELPDVLQSDAAAGAMFSEITAQPREVVLRPIRGNRRWWAAAAAVLALGTGIWFLARPVKHTGVAIVTQGTLNDALPGKEGAVLTLANGQQVVLDSLGNAEVATQNGAKIVIRNGQLVYNPAENAGGELQYNKITTPKGRQYSVVLPDGSRAWLNAASSLRYPVVFNGTERRVEVTGEVYFEVAQHANKPFFVQVQEGPEIRVLGTDFNINAYSDEHAIQTTLLKGSIHVVAGNGTPVVLKPGQQASMARNAENVQLKEADQEQVMAWKNGNFYFDRADIRSIMRQLSRWYDVEVVYESVPEKKFSGTIPRNVNVSQVFSILESTNNVHFKIEGNKVTVAR